ncbi:N,N'-diacetylbacillosaminyl-diphospho-undecaprenol alpha-1,3-N-acetylgalactosaminyltransferase [compost metagenome]
MPALLQQSDVMVLPSLQDNLPFSIMEAQLSETPIIASNAGGIPEMIEHGRTGLLFDNTNEEQLAERINKMMMDADLRQSIAKQASGWAHVQWSSTTLLKRTLSVYEQALARVRGS